jgi:CheY-like chemotaxis protein
MHGCPCILYVEDEPNDVALFEFACRRAKVSFALKTAADGEQAITYLGGVESHVAGKPDQLPALVLLDLKLPRLSGFDVLKWIRAQPQFTHLPVVVFTSSTREEDVAVAYQTGATAYLIKPATAEELVELPKLLESFWLHWNRTPEARAERMTSG